MAKYIPLPNSHKIKMLEKRIGELKQEIKDLKNPKKSSGYSASDIIKTWPKWKRDLCCLWRPNKEEE